MSKKLSHFVKSIYSPLPEAFINWEEIEYSDHDRKQKKGKEAKVVDPDLFLQMVMIHHNFDTMQAYLCYAKVGTHHCEKGQYYFISQCQNHRIQCVKGESGITKKYAINKNHYFYQIMMKLCQNVQ